ncbi:MAG TPA: hypothetical protein VG346_05965 [Acidimicrobiales bacterium]|nr:hypothetical protein [Acidimicrobiales bacterium]
MVWYASYGSNLCAERFGCYIAGGTPRGATRPCRGARDTTSPRQDRPLEIPYPLYFAGRSRTWGGAPSFIDIVERRATPARARAYLITWEQFEDVVAQENGRGVTSPIDVAPDDLAVGRNHPFGSGRYESLLCVGRDDGTPVLTFTSPWTMAHAELGTPTPNYLRTMIDGLRESHKLRDDAITAYLGAAPGCSEELVASALAL